MTKRNLRIGVAIVLITTLLSAVVVQVRAATTSHRINIVAYFDNTNGLFQGDEVRILGVPVGRIERIEPQPKRVRVTFWVNKKYDVPAEVNAAIISPQLVTSRAIQLTPAYTDGPVLRDGGVIPQSRTAVPLEWDDLRQQLVKLTDALQPSAPGGVSTLGAFINTSAENLRGQGANIRDTVTKLSQAFSILGDHSNDTFTTIRNLSIVVSALKDSSDLLRQFNDNLATVSGALTAAPDAVGTAVKDINDVVSSTTKFIADNREALGTTADKLASVTGALHDSIDDIEQALHLFPNTLQNFINIYQPTQQGITGALTLQNFANPISFLCGGIQAASRLNSEESAKLCVQYLAPIIKNRQWNFPPLGANYFVGEAARPNEITYSEDWLRPDYRPVEATTPIAGPEPDLLPPEATDPTAGLSGMMTPHGSGS